jgi:transcription termination factor NusB
MNVEKFFNDLNEKTWRKNIRFHAERKFESLLEYIKEHKEEILSEIENDIKEVEHMKNEDKEIFDYAIFEHWLEKLTRSNISLWIDDDEEV